MKLIIKIFLIILLFLVNQCGLYKKVDSSVPIQGEDRARKNIDEGKGLSLKNLTGRGSTNYEFSSSNPMWRASLELIDFIPLTTVDYSGGIIITDWYNDINNSKEFIKITIRFLSNEISSSNIKIKIHQKKCNDLQNCTINEINSPIKNELLSAILKKAAVYEVNSKKK